MLLRHRAGVLCEELEGADPHGGALGVSSCTMSMQQQQQCATHAWQTSCSPSAASSCSSHGGGDRGACPGRPPRGDARALVISCSTSSSDSSSSSGTPSPPDSPAVPAAAAAAAAVAAGTRAYLEDPFLQLSRRPFSFADDDDGTSPWAAPPAGVRSSSSSSNSGHDDGLVSSRAPAAIDFLLCALALHDQQAQERVVQERAGAAAGPAAASIDSSKAAGQ